MISVGILMIVGMVIWVVIESVRTNERGNQHRIIRRLFGGLTNRKTISSWALLLHQLVGQIQAEQKLSSGKIVEGLRLLYRHNARKHLRDYFEGGFSLPGEPHSLGFENSPRQLLKGILDQLEELEFALNCYNPYVMPVIKDEMRYGIESVYEVVWDSCQRLSLVEQHGWKWSFFEEELEAETKRLNDLFSEIVRTRYQLTRLALTHKTPDLAFETAQHILRQVREQSTNRLEAGSLSGG